MLNGGVDLKLQDMVSRRVSSFADHAEDSYAEGQDLGLML